MKYYFPFSYGILSRSKTILHKASFLILIIFPIFATGMFIKTDLKKDEQFITILCGFVAMYCVYEIGYMYNDIITTQFEKMPSYWVPLEDVKRLRYKFELIIASRLVYIGICLYVLEQLNNLYIVQFIIALILLYLIYAFHNSIRGRWNIVTDLGLQIFKYGAPLLLLSDLGKSGLYLLIVFLEVPFIRWIEYFGKKRLNIKLMEFININILRIIYHLSMCIIALILKKNIYEMRILLIVSTVLLGFRIISICLLKNKKISDLRMANFESVK
ncbi:MAG: hypothetical protein HFG76_00025 [Hungatella sp.]|nr:hypothetical protein [Hungatella sp.]